jgi:uncharacterized SAM-binding protein YcdF (DUF218 family)
MQQLVRLGLIKRKNMWVPTFFGSILLLLLSIISIIITISKVHSFLAVDHPINSNIMVVEGWLPDNALENALSEFKAHNYHLMVVTSKPIEKGHYLYRYNNYGELAAAILEHLGLNRNAIVVIPVPDVTKDRTYASAIAVNNWIINSNLSIKSFNLVTLGTHARRSRLVFHKVMGDKITVGVIALNDNSYDKKKWWKSSMGVRATLYELIAYVYTKLCFLF